MTNSGGRFDPSWSLVWKLLFSFWAFAMAYAAARQGGLALTTNLAAAAVAVPTPWVGRGLLRFLRLAGGGVAAVSGAVASLILGAMFSGPVDETGTTEAAWVLFAVVTAGTAAWICELRSSKEEAAEAERVANERHSEVLAAIARLDARLDEPGATGAD